MSRRRDPPRAGYVLIEALATLALGALVLTGAATLVAVMLRSADRTALALEQMETGGRAVAALERDLAAVTRLSRPGQSAETMVFLGEPEALSFVIERTDRDGFAEPVLVRWTSEETTAGRGRLIRSEAPILPGVAVPEEPGDPVSVDTGRAVVRFAYFAPQPDGSGEVLMDTWNDPARMPAAIRIARSAPGSIEVETSVRVPIRTDAEIACLGLPGYCSLTGSRNDERRAAPTTASGGAVEPPADPVDPGRPGRPGRPRPGDPDPRDGGRGN